ncbi:MAG TPA: DUF3099 domain-containing protein [Microbacterium sp.]|uniref:DUF3099 domain-containing protein n=1 Tax=Microbacterium sp. TaxID=51671 RepID=UPI002B46DAFF|nr:DUF3099 domain-containing protein [Microbacterium sp.]HKT56613.1 DUF3099 domain-containing protein [Microbacterium sp.]
MKHHSTQSATSIPASPEEEVDRRSTRYLIMMGIRVACFALAVLVHPYSWYTWLFLIAAVVLPYIAVVLANVGQESKTPNAVVPEQALPATPTPDPHPHTGPSVIRVTESTRSLPHTAEPAAADGDTPPEPPDQRESGSAG